MATIKCPNCAAESPPGAIFCDNCGYDLRNVPQNISPPVSPTVSSSAAEGLICINCGHQNPVEAIFCENCGSKIVQQPPQKPPLQPEPPTPIRKQIVGRLVIQSTNTDLPFPSGKPQITLGREDPVSSIFPDIDLTPYGAQEAGVGRQHARITIQNQAVYIEDLNSVNGTLVNKQRIPPNQPVQLNNGDEIRLGLLVINFYTT